MCHRVPLPEPVLEAMVGLSLAGGHQRFGAVLLGAFRSVARVGEWINAHRRDLLLPSDLLSPDTSRAFLTIGAPKSGKRGGARSQHVLVEGTWTVSILEWVFAGLAADCLLFSGGARRFRERWDILLSAMLLEPSLNLVPGGVRGGGAVSLFRAGVSIEDLRWRMRIKSHDTLAHYLQEAMALEVLPRASNQARLAVQAGSRYFRALGP